MINCFLLLACLLFSFACNLIRKLYDDRDYSTVYEMLKSAAVSGLAGFVFAMVLSEFFASPILILGLSGIGGFFGTRALTLLIQSNISSRLSTGDMLKQLLEEETARLANSTHTDSLNDTQNNQQTNHNINCNQ